MTLRQNSLETLGLYGLLSCWDGTAAETDMTLAYGTNGLNIEKHSDNDTVSDVLTYNQMLRSDESVNYCEIELTDLKLNKRLRNVRHHVVLRMASTTSLHLHQQSWRKSLATVSRHLTPEIATAWSIVLKNILSFAICVKFREILCSFLKHAVATFWTLRNHTRNQSLWK